MEFHRVIPYLDGAQAKAISTRRPTSNSSFTPTSWSLWLSTWTSMNQSRTMQWTWQARATRIRKKTTNASMPSLGVSLWTVRSSSQQSSTNVPSVCGRTKHFPTGSTDGPTSTSKTVPPTSSLRTCATPTSWWTWLRTTTSVETCQQSSSNLSPRTRTRSTLSSDA